MSFNKVNTKANGVVAKMFQAAVDSGYSWLVLSAFSLVFLVIGWQACSYVTAAYSWLKSLVA